MSRINGEKARAAIARKRRTAQREKDRAKLAQIRSGAATQGSGDDKNNKTAEK
ncbi:MAG TPA: hypothetical protein VGF48_13655 [Thermoanaerobaculia bacterium]|jgi:hypothetical protein